MASSRPSRRVVPSARLGAENMAPHDFSLHRNMNSAARKAAVEDSDPTSESSEPILSTQSAQSEPAPSGDDTDSMAGSARPGNLKKPKKKKPKQKKNSSEPIST